MHLFIDTTEFDQAGQNVLHHNFVHVKEYAGDELLTLVIPDVTLREWRRHLEKSLEQCRASAIKSLQQLRRRAGVKSNDEGELDDLVGRSWSTFDEFVDGDGVVHLPSSAADVDEIVVDYFEGKAPFGDGKKKHEFPDAIVVSSLRKHARESGTRVAVVSGDSDLQRACERFPSELELVPSLAEALERALLAHEDAADAVIAEALSQCEESLLPLEIIQEKLDGVAIDFDEYDRYDASFDDLTIEEVLEVSLHVVEVDAATSSVEVSGQLKIGISGSISSDDPEFMYRDSDTKDFVFLARLYESVTATVETDVWGVVDREELLAESAQWVELDLATSGTLRVPDFSVKSSRSTADDPEWHGNQ